MAKTYHYSFARTSWEERKSATYTPAGERDSEGRTVDAYGRLEHSTFYNHPAAPPVKAVEEDGPVIFIQYAGAAAVIKIDSVEA